LSEIQADEVITYSSYLGGSGIENLVIAGEVVGGIAVDGSGSTYVIGAGSSDLPTTGCAFQSGYGGGSSDAFVTKWSADGGALLLSSFLGGSSSDQGNIVAVDEAGNTYLTGETLSSDFPTMNPFQAALGGGADAFIARITQ